MEFWGILVTEATERTGPGGMKYWWTTSVAGEYFVASPEACAGMAELLAEQEGRGASFTAAPIPLYLWPERFQMAALIEAVRDLAEAVGAREGK